MMVDGGLLIVASYSGNKRFPLQLQIKEVDELDSSVLFHGKNQVVGGIEVNSFNKPVAYHLSLIHIYQNICGYLPDSIFPAMCCRNIPF